VLGAIKMSLGSSAGRGNKERKKGLLPGQGAIKCENHIQGACHQKASSKKRWKEEGREMGNEGGKGKF